MVEFDVIIVGGGMNSITAGAYLQKAGLNVAIIERNIEGAGFGTTVEPMIPGVIVNTHATAIVANMSPAVEDLELEKYGLKLRSAPWGYGSLSPTDEKCLLIHNYDYEKTAANWARFSEKDARTLRELTRKFLPYAIEFVKLYYYTPATPENRERILDILSEVSGFSPEEIADATGFKILDELYEEERVKMTIALMGYDYGGPPDIKGWGGQNAILGPFYAPISAPLGGTHSLVHALVRCFIAHGGTFLLCCPVEKIIVEDNQAKGVLLSKDAAYPTREIRARKAVVSNVTPPGTLKLLEEDNMKKVDSTMASKMKYWELSFAVCLHCHFLTRGPPRWKSASFDPNIRWPQFIFTLQKDLQDTHIQMTRKEAGYVHSTLGKDGAITRLSPIDPKQAPAGYDITSWLQFMPLDPRIEGGVKIWSDPDFRREIISTLTGEMDKYAEGFSKSVVKTFLTTPIDAARHNAETRGNIVGGDLSAHQDYLDRMPVRLPIKNMYTVAGIWYPSFSFLSGGYNAATVIAEDLNVRKQDWWVHKPMEWAFNNAHRIVVGE